MNIQKLDANEFRQKLAGLKTEDVQSDTIKYSLIEEAVDFVSELPKIFGSELDRKTLWERIGNGLITASVKADGNLELFVNSLLAYIKAPINIVATNDQIGNFIKNINSREKDWKQNFIRQFQMYSYLIVVKSREKWETEKKKKVEVKNEE